VLVAAPHTSNWDGLIIVVAAFAFDLRLAWIAKRELFRGPVGWFLTWMGGIPVQRAAAHDAARDAVRALLRRERLPLAIPPEGTRQRTDHWKMGFYLIARAARVPIVLGFVDYRRRVVGLGPALTPSGNVAADMALMRDFYQSVTAKYPQQVGQIQPPPR
jgi:1-acyl-sn-glycerol-3-phosphate acyltransferase